MEFLTDHAAFFIKAVAGGLSYERFVLVDVGCSGGIDGNWRNFGDRLTAFAFEPNLEECSRLQAEESWPHVEYVPAFVGGSPKVALFLKGA